MRPDPVTLRAGGTALLAGAATALLVALAARPAPAEAFPWMVHHGYTACAQCHVDPSGAGVLTAYGRAQGEILLRTRYGEGEVENPGKVKDFLFGAVPLPETLHLQADVRSVVVPDPDQVRVLLMQSDLRGAVQTKSFVASASLGAVSDGAEAARVSSGDTWNLVSREYWAGVTPSKAFTIRAGRMNLPFGLRTEDHILDVRQATRTTLNDDQQTGVSVFWNSRKWRAEVMGIAGNFQVRPDSFRDRGYSLYVAYAPVTTLEIGASSLLATAKTDLATLAPNTRLVEGLFARWAPIPELALLAEGDVLLQTRDGDPTTGFVSTAILDWEPTQGLHVQAIGEQCDDAFGDGAATSATGTGALQWFFGPHVDLRVDGGYGQITCTPGAESFPFAAIQGHFYL